MSDKPLHTPGPWTVEPISDRVTGISADGIWIAKLPAHEDTEANARLIAAAPIGYELAEAVEAGPTIPFPTTLEWENIRRLARRFMEAAEPQEER